MANNLALDLTSFHNVWVLCFSDRLLEDGHVGRKRLEQCLLSLSQSKHDERVRGGPRGQHEYLGGQSRSELSIDMYVFSTEKIIKKF